MKKILYLSYDGMTDPLGQSQVLPYLIALSKNFQIHLISFEKPESYKSLKNNIQNQIHGENIIWHPKKYNKWPPIISTIWDLFNLYFYSLKLHKKEHFNLIHCRSHLTGLIGLNLKKRINIPFLFDMRSFFPDERVDGNLWPQSNLIFRLIYNFFKSKELLMLKEADEVVVLTNAAKKILSRNHNKSKISIIPCCADFDHFNFKKINPNDVNDVRKTMKISNSTFVLSYLGSLGTWYLLPEMMNFFKELKKVKKDSVFLFLTNVDEAYINKVAQLHGVSLGDIRIEFVSRDELPIYLSVSDVSIFFIQNTFSKQASSPTKHAELMGLGIPVIANSGIGDTDSIIMNSDTGVIINLEDSSSIIKCINNIDLVSTFDKKLIRERGRKIFDLHEGVKRYEEIYLKICS